MRFLQDSKDFAGARTRFQRLITDVLGVGMPGSSEIAYPGGGDWGIDTYVGELDDVVVVWQSKFFLDWGVHQQGQIRSSFKQLMKNAEEQGFTVSSWILCVPSTLPPPDQKWWDGFSKRNSKKFGVRIELMNGVQLRRKLQQPDITWVRELYFPDVGSVTQPIALKQIEDVGALEDALFVAQLREAGQVETNAAKGFFFAAEAMARDVASRGIGKESDALQEIQLEIHGAWESGFTSQTSSADSNGRMDGLVRAVTDEAAAFASSSDLNLKPSHRRGLVHRLVETSKAGWVLHWRALARDFSGVPASQALEEAGHFQLPQAQKVENHD
jgi:hypothetical protein